MGYIIKIGPTVIGHVTGDYAVLHPRFAIETESCLLAFKVQAYLGDEERTPVTYGFKIVGPNPDVIANAIKRCIALVNHRRPRIVEEKIYVVEAKKENQEGGGKIENLFEQG